jgi:hypothetical protein
MPKAGKDFWSGVMFLGFAGVGILVARGHALGSAGQMGPGYFPMLLGIVLGLIGAILIGRAVLAGDAPVDRIAIRPVLTLVIAVVVFGLTIERLGLVLALILAVAIAGFASRESRPLEVAALAGGLALLSLGIFHGVLRLPLPLWPTF